MALSDYDSILWDSEGKCTANNGMFPNGFTVSVRKLMLYVENETIRKSIDKKHSHTYMEPIIASIDTGDVDICGITIVKDFVDLKNKFGIPYHNVYRFYCYYRDYVEGTNQLKLIQYGGILCYGHLDIAAYEAQRRGLLTQYPGFEWSHGSTHDENGKSEQLIGWPPDGSLDSTVEIDVPVGTFDFEKSWCGVTQDMIDNYLSWNIPDPDWLAKVKQSDMLRFNQGDAYIANALEQPVEGTKPEESELPIAIKMIQGDEESI